MKSFLMLENRQESPLPDGVPGPDMRFPPRLVELFLEEYTRPGDRVLDPFAGFGTTLLVAERMGRVPLGIEFNPQRCAYAQSLLQTANCLFQGDARRLAYDLPPL